MQKQSSIWYHWWMDKFSHGYCGMPEADPEHQVGGGYILNNRARSAREIFGHAHLRENHTQIAAANETSSPRYQWNPTFSPYKQVFSYILYQIKVHQLKGGW